MRGIVSKRRALLALALTALVAGAAVAILVAVSGGKAHTPLPLAGDRTDLAAAASYLGVSQQRLREELQGGETLAELADATPGKSAAGLEDAIVDAKSKHIKTEAETGKLSPHQESARLRRLRQRARAVLRRSHGARQRTVATQAARYLGIPAQKLLAEEQAGRSLAQIAGATAGRSARGLIDSLMKADRKTIAKAAAAGRISHATESRLLEGLRRRVSSEVEGP